MVLKKKSLCQVFNPWCTRYYTRAGAENAMRFINGTRLDDRIIRTDWDAGFKEGRQYGRGKSGGQVRSCSLCRFVCTCIIFLFFLCDLNLPLFRL